jgi:hypothetical protein
MMIEGHGGLIALGHDPGLMLGHPGLMLGHPGLMLGHPGIRMICKYCRCEIDNEADGDHSSSCPRYSGPAGGASFIRSLRRSVGSRRSRRSSMTNARSCYSSSSDNVTTLYHETDAECARSILQSQTFRCGADGMVGGGIYFAAFAADTGHKAHKRGVLLKARVNLGRIKTVEHGREAGVNARTVRAEGYDSVKINRHGGTEYCVYDSSRVTSVELMAINKSSSKRAVKKCSSKKGSSKKAVKKSSSKKLSSRLSDRLMRHLFRRLDL